MRSSTVQLGGIVNQLTSQMGANIGGLSGAVNQLSSALTGAINPATLVATAITLLATALFKAANAQDELIKSTIEYGSRIHDLAEKTGLATETLSGLDLATKQSGTTLEDFTKGFFILQRNVESGSPEIRKLAESFGITRENVGDADATVRRFFVGISKLPTEAQRNAAGAKLMGRSYQELAVFLADTGGNIDAVIDKAREAGEVMGGEAADAADRLGDRLDALNFQSAALKRIFAEQLLPEMEVELDFFSAALNRNKQIAKEWGSEVAKQASIAEAGIRVVLGLMNFMQMGGATQEDLDKAIKSRQAEEMADVARRAGERVSRRGGGGLPSGGGKHGGGGGGEGDSLAKAREETIKAGAEAATNVWRDQLHRQEDILKQSLDRDQVSYEDYYRQLEVLQKADLQIQLDNLHEQLNAQTNQLNSTTKPANKERIVKDIQTTLGAITILEQQSADVARNIEFEKNQKIEELEQAHFDSRLRLQEELNRNMDERQKQAIENGIQTFAAAEEIRFNAETDILKAQAAKQNEIMSSSVFGSEAYQKAADELDIIYERIEGATLKHNALMRDSRLKDLDDSQSYTRRLQSIYNEVIDITRETAEIRLRSLDENYLRRDEMIKKEATLEKAAESERLRRATNELQMERARLDLERKIIEEAGGNSSQHVKLIAAVDRQIEAEKRKSAATQIDIDRQAREKMMEKWREVAHDISHIISDEMKGGWDAVLKDFEDLLSQIEEELLNSVLEQILTGQTQGSSSGGIVGAIVNKILGTLGLGGKTNEQDTNTQAVDVNTTSTEVNTTAIDQNTFALEQLTAAMESAASASGAGGIGGGGGFWSGLASAIIGGALAGIGGGGGGGGGGGFGDVVGSDVGGWGTFGSMIGSPHAEGGPVKGGWLYPVNEKGTEYFEPGVDGHIYNQEQMAQRGRGKERPNQTFILNLPPSRGGAYSQPRNQYEVLERFAKLVK